MSRRLRAASQKEIAEILYGKSDEFGADELVQEPYMLPVHAKVKLIATQVKCVVREEIENLRRSSSHMVRVIVTVNALPGCIHPEEL